MPNGLRPEIGQWYRNNDEEPFEVTHVDRVNGIIDVEYLEGATTEFNLAMWRALDIQAVACPMEQTVALDNDDLEDAARAR